MHGLQFIAIFLVHGPIVVMLFKGIHDLSSIGPFSLAHKIRKTCRLLKACFVLMVLPIWDNGVEKHLYHQIWSHNSKKINQKNMLSLREETKWNKSFQSHSKVKDENQFETWYNWKMKPLVNDE
jgi:hypothetical protein